jgi:hypothetical protein
MFKIYGELYPDVELLTPPSPAAPAPYAKAVLATRLAGGRSPDSFQFTLASGREILSRGISGAHR